MEQCQFLKTESEISHNAILYQYPGGEFEIIARNFGFWYESGYVEATDSTKVFTAREKGKKSEGKDMIRSMQRARAQVRRLALANEFRYFVTLTLDPAKIDRYDGTAITKALSRWCDNMVRRHGLKYIIVPERHKDGAFHFHGFFTDAVEVVDSGHKDERGKVIWNLPQWKLGFSTAMELYGEYSAAVAYVCKYIGKQDGQRALGRWYYSGGALKPPVKSYIDVDYADIAADGIEFAIPGTKIAILKGKGEQNEQKP